MLQLRGSILCGPLTEAIARFSKHHVQFLASFPRSLAPSLVQHSDRHGSGAGRLAVLNRNAQRARGALQTVVQDGGGSTVTATVWPQLGDRVLPGDVARSFDGSW